MIWTAEAKAELAQLMIAGATAEKAGEHFGVTRSAITGLIFRDPELNAVGLTRKRKSHGGGQAVKRTPEEITAWRKQYMKAYRRKKQTMINGSGNVIPFPKPKRNAAVHSDRKLSHPPALRVVSHNVPMLVQDWLDRNGGARRFDFAVSSDQLFLRSWLDERGVTLNQVGNNWNRGSGNWTVSSGSGRPKVMKWSSVLEIVDEMRVAEGLQPFTPGSAPPGAVG